MLVLTRCNTFPAKSGLLSIDTIFTLGLLKAVEEGVEQAWRTRKAQLPAESGLKHKSFAWLAADLLGDPFLPSEIAEKLGKAMQTRSVGLKREEKTERDRSSRERRAAKEPSQQSSKCHTDSAIASRLHTRLEALLNQPYPAYARAYRPSLDAASKSPVVAAADANAAETAMTAAETEVDVAEAAAVVAAVAAHDVRPRRTRSSEEGDRDEWDEGHAAGVALGASLRSTRAANRYHQERLEIGELHEKELEAGKTQAVLDGRMEILLELKEQISKVTDKIDKGPQQLFSRREMARAFDPLGEWAEEQISGGEVPLEEQLEQASLALHGAMWAAAEKDTPPYWAKTEEYEGRL